MKTSKKATTVLVTLVAIVALALALFAVGCANSSEPKVTHDSSADSSQAAASDAGGEAEEPAEAGEADDAETSTAAAEPGTMASYATVYPLEYNSSQETRINAKGFTIGHSIHNLRDICERPVARDVNGDIAWNENGTMSVYACEYDEELGKYIVPDLTEEQLTEANLKTGCLSCKTSQFNNLYELQGPTAYGHVYDAEARAIVADEYWDCAMCHTGDPSAESLSPNLVYFQALGEGLAEQLDPKMAVCAQCHNSYDYRSKIQTEEDLATFRPYRYGNDADAVFKSAYEDGVNFFENDLGLPEAYVVHANVEGFMTTNHNKMGLTCVDCHMPVRTDEETGEQYRSHFSASSPLESEEALSFCLTCHTSQGIESTEAMKEFVQGKEATLATSLEELKTSIDAYGENLSKAIADSALDEAAQEQAKEDYAKATWYYQVMITGPYESVGSQVAMVDSTDMLAKAHAAIEDGTALIG